MAASVLFDEPGPKGLLRQRIYSGLVLLAFALILFWVYRQLDAHDQFDSRYFEQLFSDGSMRAIRNGLQATLTAAGIAIVTSIVFGLALAVARLSDRGWIRRPAGVVVEFFRAVPLLLLIFVLFFFYQTDVGLERQSAALAGLVTGLTLYNGAVLAEVFRAGINAVPRGQSEAAYAIGLRKTQVMQIVLIPQAVRFMLPAIISQCVVVLKDTSLGFIIAYPELLREGKNIATSVGSSLWTYVLIALIYITLNSVLGLLAGWVHRRMSERGPRAAKAVEAVEEVIPVG